jgi:hypothetical protein
VLVSGFRAGVCCVLYAGRAVLDPLKARLFLHVLLAGGVNREEIATAFRAAGGYGQP